MPKPKLNEEVEVPDLLELQQGARVRWERRSVNKGWWWWWDLALREGLVVKVRRGGREWKGLRAWMWEGLHDNLNGTPSCCAILPSFPQAKTKYLLVLAIQFMHSTLSLLLLACQSHKAKGLLTKRLCNSKKGDKDVWKNEIYYICIERGLIVFFLLWIFNF